MNKKVGIFIVTFNQPEYFKRCVDSIKRNTDYDYELSTHDNSEKNEGVNTIFNRMIAKSDADYFCTMNDDVVVTKGWLTSMMKGFDDKEIAAVGPMTSWGVPQQIDEYVNDRNDVTIEEIEKRGALIHDETRNVKKMDRSLNGFCWMFSREAYEKVGGLNEELMFCGHETEMCMKFFKEGYKIGVIGNAYVHHYGSVSINKAVKEGTLDRKLDIEIAEKICSE